MIKAKDVDEYISGFPEETQEIMQRIRATIKKAAPNASEIISYGMPAYKMNGVLVYFGGYKNHIGFYPTGSGIAAFEKELVGFKSSKGAVQFALDKPLPVKLITQMVKFRLEDDAQKAKMKKAKNGKLD